MQICAMPLALSLSATLAYLIIAITDSLHQLLQRFMKLVISILLVLMEPAYFLGNNAVYEKRAKRTFQ